MALSPRPSRSAERTEHPRDRLLRAAVVLIATCSLYLTFELAGSSPYLVRRTLMRAAILILLGAGWARLWRTGWAIRLLALPAALVALMTPHLSVAMLAAIAMIFTFEWAASSLAGAWPRGLALGLMVATLVNLSRAIFPGAWALVEATWRTVVGALLPLLEGEHVAPGIVAGGLLAYASAACIVLSLAMMGRTLRPLLVLAAGAAAFAVFLRCCYVPAAETLTSSSWAEHAARSSAALGATVAGVSALFHQRLTPEARPVLSERLSVKARPAVTLFACLLALACVTALWGVQLGSRSARGVVLFYNRGGIDWDTPRYGRFGAFSSGMFGLLPHALARNGYDTLFAEPTDDLEQALARASIFVLINCDEEWDGSRKQMLLDFVAKGGGLLVLGDHTDVFGLMKGLNSLLVDLGIRFHFDSAYPLSGEGLAGKLLSAPGPLHWRRDADTAPMIAVGASLEVHPPARAEVWADYAFSDSGNRWNEQGSFLGNYFLDPGETIGNMALVASRLYGRGKILVFGDTSSFQNASLGWSSEDEILPVFDWLATPQAFYDRREIQAAALAGLALLAVLFMRRPARGASLYFLFTIVGALLLNHTCCAPLASRPLRIDASTAVFPEGHAQPVGHYEAGGNAVGPLITCLHRSGFWVACPKRLEPGGDWQRSGLVALIAPQEHLEDDLLEALLEYQAHGGILLLAVSARDAGGSKELLAKLGVRLAPALLGMNRSVDGETVTFLDPSHVHFEEGREGVELARAYDGTVAAFCRYGRGGTILVADTRFFSGRNIENTDTFNRANLAFIDQVLRRYAGAIPDRYAPPHCDPAPPPPSSTE
ncbi:MAG: DUF4350 domain-containing protein [Planctomycetota bacterium]